MSVFSVAIPVVALAAALFLAVQAVRKHGGKKVYLMHFAALAIVLSLCIGFAVSASAAPADTIETVAAEELSAEVPTTQTDGLGLGLGLLAAGLAAGLSFVGAGLALASASPAAIGATSEDPKAFGKVIVFVVLGEALALYGILVAYLILAKL